MLRKLAEVAKSCRQGAITCPIKVGCRGFVRSSTVCLLRDGMHRSRVSENHQRTGRGGREGHLLAVAKEEAQELGAE